MKADREFRVRKLFIYLSCHSNNQSMKRSLLSFGLYLLCTSSYAQKSSTVSTLATQYKDSINKAEGFYNEKKYLESGKVYTSAFDLLGGKGQIKDRYNAARSWALAKVPDSALFCLQRIAEKGYFADIDKIKKEEDFNSLHSDARWQPVLDEILKNKENQLPEGWYRAGSKPNSYAMHLDKGAGKDGNDVITIKSVDRLIDGFGTVMQSFMLEKYLGKRIKMTGYLKTRDVEDWAGLWLRVDGKKYKLLAFDNMKNGKRDRSVTGNTDWKQYEIVLDVPDEAINISFGTLLSGKGQVWFDKIDFEVVSKKTETTGRDMKFLAPKGVQFSE